jgi:tRNA (cmo5U34)-methyltransferase
LSSGANPDDFETLLRAWLTAMAGPGVSAERVERARAAYARDVAVLSPATVASIIESGGFERPMQLFQAGLLHAWCSRRPSEGLI